MKWLRRKQQAEPDLPPEMQAVYKHLLEHEEAGPALMHWLGARKLPWWVSLDPDCPSVAAAKQAAASEHFDEVDPLMHQFAQAHALSNCARCHAHMLRTVAQM
jgi:hypothetical protein